MATPYFKAVGVLSVAESRSWVTHFFIAQNGIYLPSNMPSPTLLHQVRTAQANAPRSQRGAGRRSATCMPTAPPVGHRPGDRQDQTGKSALGTSGPALGLGIFREQTLAPSPWEVNGR